MVAALADPVPFPAGRQLAFVAKTLDDTEAMRTASENRLRTLTRGGPADERITSGKVATVAELEADADGEERGYALTEDDPAVKLLTATVAMYADVEAQTIKLLQKLMREHPLGPWMAAQRSVGEKQGARLLAALGDPYIRPEIVLEDGTVEPSRPRMVSELISYAGWMPGANGGAAPRRRRGETVRHNPDARKRSWLVIDSCLKGVGGKTAETCIADDNGWIKHADECVCSPYRVVYDDARRQYAETLHVEDCPQCKAKAGEPLRLGHQKARAMRLAARQLIKDLWAEARRIHVEQGAENQ
jgi:hypothetical protein